MNIFKKMFAIIAIGLACFLGSGCSGKEAVKNLVVKTHTLVVNVSTYVQKVDPQTLVSQAAKLETPLNIIGKALQLVASRVEDQDMKTKLNEVSDTLLTVAQALPNLDPEKIEMMRGDIVDKLGKAIDILRKVSDYLGAPKVKSVTVTPSLEDIESLAKSLEDAMQEAKK